MARPFTVQYSSGPCPECGQLVQKGDEAIYSTRVVGKLAHADCEGVDDSTWLDDEDLYWDSP